MCIFLLFYVHHYSGMYNVYGGESAYDMVDIYDWFSVGWEEEYMAKKWLVEKEKKNFFKKKEEESLNIVGVTYILTENGWWYLN